MCTLKAIWIEKKLESIGYGGSIIQSGFVIGNAMGLRSSLFATPNSFAAIYSWKEQKLFGLDQPEFLFDPQLPVFSIEQVSQTNPTLLYLFLHEMAHMFDTCNQVTGYEIVGSKVQWPRGGWGEFDWVEPDKPKPDSVMAKYAGKICFYGCPSHLPLESIHDLYADISRSDLLTAYADVDIREDFAESSAFYFLSTYYHQNVMLRMRGEPLLNISKHVDEPSFREKNAFLRNFYSSSPKLEFPFDP